MAAELWQSLLQAQARVRGIAPEGTNPRFGKHVRLDDVLDKVVPALLEEGLVLTQTPTPEGLTTTIIHAATGQSTTSTMPLFLAKEDSQAQGSAITYARRYSLMAIMALKGDGDDDGEAASAPRQEAARPTPPKLSEEARQSVSQLAKKASGISEPSQAPLATPSDPVSEPMAARTPPGRSDDRINQWTIDALKKAFLKLREVDPLCSAMEWWDSIDQADLARMSDEKGKRMLQRAVDLIAEAEELGPKLAPEPSPLADVPS